MAQSGPFRLVDVSFNTQFAVGSSTERDAVLESLQGGGHDPRKRGFTLQNAELGLSGAVDPYFEAQAYLIAFLDPYEGETVVELEEAYLVSLALPEGLQLKAGAYLTEFGRVNAVHPHSWDWQDQPVVATRFFGPDGLRGPGARLSWLLPVESYWELIGGVQNANGETAFSFLANEEVYEERPVGGRFFTEQDVRAFSDLLWTGRLMTSHDLGAETSFGLGASVAYGPNATGGGVDTLIYGLDLVVRWRPEDAQRGWPFVKVEGEVLARRFDAAQQVDENDPAIPGDDVVLPATTLDDWGFYLQAVWGFTPGWAVGMRGEWATGAGASYDAATDVFDRSTDPFRSDRLRLSPLLAFHPSEFSRIRLQYNYDDTDWLADPVHSVWLGFDVLIGKHAPHKY
jgi:hypothetical protein